MTDDGDWEFPADARPKQKDLAFDLDAALSAVVALHAKIPEDAFTASVLGTERAGNGVLIGDDGLVVTVGYLITEAEMVWLTAGDGTTVPAHVVAYDNTTGLGLVQALGRLGVAPLELGASRDSEVGAQVVVAGPGGHRRALEARVVARHEFAGYWEYVLDEAVFTAPPHPNWGGAALIGRDGRLQGIGSLFVQGVRLGSASLEGNMIVPIDLLPPILDELLKLGKVDAPPRPWLGMYTADMDDKLVVVGLADGGPAAAANVRPGDQVLRVAGEAVPDLATMFRRIWGLGPAGVDIPLTIRRDGEEREIEIRSADRATYLKAPRLH
jgi:S1-C subfamily serine protease